MRIMKSRVNLPISLCFGRDSGPANLGCNPESITNLNGPISHRLQFAPIPPWAFRSVNFMNVMDQSHHHQEYPGEMVSFLYEFDC